VRGTRAGGEVKVDREILNREPFRSIVEHAIGMTNAVAEYSGKRGITRICLTPDFGLMLGLLPRQSIDVSTPSGLVELYVEATARLSGRLTMEPYVSEDP